ncbi:hypothetical protein CDAR_487791 [Caerostris darwini]|uniref:Uncharacterized protein n=1 Tax=Caerostris darwini TaxID=1538125 RepID=A0AAV4PTL5_9ARAC|nr:hypothetical protein CDAR_487791 [Caerostris darwini]
MDTNLSNLRRRFPLGAILSSISQCQTFQSIAKSGFFYSQRNGDVYRKLSGCKKAPPFFFLTKARGWQKAESAFKYGYESVKSETEVSLSNPSRKVDSFIPREMEMFM